MKRKLSIKGMSCQHCVRRVIAALKEEAGAESVSVDLEKGSALVEGAALDDGALRAAVQDAGYDLVSLAAAD